MLTKWVTDPILKLTGNNINLFFIIILLHPFLPLSGYGSVVPPLTPTAVAASLGAFFFLLLSTHLVALKVFSRMTSHAVGATSTVARCPRLTQSVVLMDSVCPDSGPAAPPTAVRTGLAGIHTLAS